MSSAKQFWPLIFGIVPFAVLLYGIINFAVDMPFADDWGMVPYLQKSVEGTLTVRDLFDQHNESRIFFPRIVLIVLARLTGWNTFYEMAAIVLTVSFTFLLLAVQSIRTSLTFSGKRHSWLCVFVSALIFSLLQYRCWTFGFTLVGYISILGVVAGLVLLTSAQFSWARFAGALMAGTIAAYSYSNGLLFWLIGLIPLFALLREQPFQGPRIGGQGSVRMLWRQHARSVSPYLIWILVAAGVLALYFNGFQVNPDHPPFFFFLNHPFIFLDYLFAFLGGAIVNIPQLPMSVPITIGMIGLLIFILCGLLCFYLPGRELKSVSPWLALGAYVVLSGLAAALGRSAYGPRNALASRYTMFSGLFWISLLVMGTVTLDFRDRPDREKKKRAGRAFLKKGLFLFTVVCVMFFILSSCYAMKAWKQHHRYLRSLRNELLSFLPDESLLETSFPATDQLQIWADWVTKQRLYVFRNKKAFEEFQIVEAVAGHIESVEVDLLPDKVFSDGTAQLSGQACDPERGQAARAVLLVNSNRLIIARADVTPDSQARWSLAFKATKLPVGKSTVNVYALFQDGTRIARIGELNLEIFPVSDMKKIFQINNFIDHPVVRAGTADIFYLDNDLVRGSGWARNPATDQPAKWIAVINQQTNILAYARITDERKDVADQFNNMDLFLCGWQAAFDTTLLEPGRHVLWAYMFLPNKKMGLRLNNCFEVMIP